MWLLTLNNNMQLHLCTDAAPSFLGFFDLSIAPPLLYYAYIPIFFLGMSIGIFTLKQDGFSTKSKYFLGINLCFATYIFLSLVQWVGAYLETVHLAWQLYILPEVSIFLFSILFSYALINGREAPAYFKFFIIAILTFLALILPTKLNIEAFDFNNCEGINGKIWSFEYIFELLCIFVIVFIALARFFSKQGQIERRKILLFTTGQVIFLGIFWASNYFGEITKTYQINLIGPIGMILFLASLTYMMTKFKTFNTKIFGSQALVGALVFLIGAILFIRQIEYVRIVVLFTLVLLCILGFSLIKSVKREILQREKIEKLAIDLEKANAQLKELDRQKDELLSIVSHQLATPVSAVKWNLEMMLEGDMGKLTKEEEESLKSLQGVTTNLADLVSMILDVSRIQLGRMKIEKQELDLNAFFKEILDVIQPKAKEKKVQFNIAMPATLPKAKLDKRYTHMTIENLLSNAVKYTPENGTVNFTITINNNSMHCEVKDTGMGIPKQEQDKIFGKMYRATNARNAVDGNGFGLYVAKGAVEAQGGKIWFESEEGKGTTFFVDLPLSSTDEKDDLTKKT